jgi:hypothetical protein
MELANRIGLFVLGAVLVGVAGLVVWMSGRQGRIAARSSSWPTVSGTVESSDVSGTWVKRGPTNIMVYAAAVKYAYEVGGARYQGFRIGFGSEFDGSPGDSGKTRAAEQAARYPVGATVNVHYAPDAPKESVLVPSSSEPFTSWSGIGIGVAMALAGLACLGFALKG